MTASGTSAFAAAVRMVHRIHSYSANGRPDSAPTVRAGFSELAEVMFVVPDLADCGSTINVDSSHLSRAQTKRRVTAFTSDDLNRTTRTSGKLTTFPGLHLHTVDQRTDGNVLQRQSVT
jgi:hypothetical protein